MYDVSFSQLVQITFHKGGIFVQFPYFADAAGLIGRIKPEISGGTQSKLEMGQQGVVSPTLVKYSHPPDGNAHFSQDGKIFTRVRRQSFPLTEEGQVFELTACFPTSFTKVDKSTAKANRLYVPFVFSDGVPATAKVTGAWWSLERLIQMQEAAERPIGPLEEFEDYRRGTKFKGFLVAPPEAHPSHMLMINAGAAPTPNGVDEPSLIFIGGWDAGVVETRVPSDLLVCSYPLSNPDEWAKRIGTVALPSDFKRTR